MIGKPFHGKVPIPLTGMVYKERIWASGKLTSSIFDVLL
jgi:hypothetical protein